MRPTARTPQAGERAAFCASIAIGAYSLTLKALNIIAPEAHVSTTNVSAALGNGAVQWVGRASDSQLGGRFAEAEMGRPTRRFYCSSRWSGASGFGLNPPRPVIGLWLEGCLALWHLRPHVACLRGESDSWANSVSKLAFILLRLLAPARLAAGGGQAGGGE